MQKNMEEQLNAPEVSPQGPQVPKTSHDLKTWVIVVLIAALAVLGFAYISDKDSSSETPSISTDDQSNDTIDGTEGSRIYQNGKYGYSFRYPPNFAEPSSTCGIASELPDDEITPEIGRSQDCDVEIGINAEPAEKELRWNPGYDDGIILRAILVRDVSLASIADFIVQDYTSEPRLASVDGKTVLSGTFRGGFSRFKQSEIDDTLEKSGGSYIEEELKLMLVRLNDEEILMITYPLEFCFVIVYDNEMNTEMRQKTECYSDERNEIYKQIISTLIFTN